LDRRGKHRLGQGQTRDTPVAMEYAAEGSYAPLVSLRYGKWKFNRCALDPDQLFDMENDPHELTNQNATCATTWTSTCSKKTNASRAANDADQGDR